MSLLSSLRDASASRCGRRDRRPGRVSAAALECRGGTPVVSAHAAEPLPEGRVRAVADGGEHPRSRRRSSPRSAASSMRVGRPGASDSSCPIWSRRCRWCGSSRCPPRAADLDQLVRWQVRKTAPFPIEDAQVSYVPGIGGIGADAGEAARSSSCPSRAGATSSRNTRRSAPRRARTPASSIWRPST